MRYDYISPFSITEEDRKIVEDGKKTHPFFDPVCFCYVKDKDILEKSYKISYHLEQEYKKLKNNCDEFRKMVAKELSNHEACITCRFDDALTALGLEYEKLDKEKKKIVNEELTKQIRNYG